MALMLVLLAVSACSTTDKKKYPPEDSRLFNSQETQPPHNAFKPDSKEQAASLEKQQEDRQIQLKNEPETESTPSQQLTAPSLENSPNSPSSRPKKTPETLLDPLNYALPSQPPEENAESIDTTNTSTHETKPLSGSAQESQVDDEYTPYSDTRPPVSIDQNSEEKQDSDDETQSKTQTGTSEEPQAFHENKTQQEEPQNTRSILPVTDPVTDLKTDDPEREAGPVLTDTSNDHELDEDNSIDKALISNQAHEVKMLEHTDSGLGSGDDLTNHQGRRIITPKKHINWNIQRKVKPDNSFSE